MIDKKRAHSRARFFHPSNSYTSLDFNYLYGY